MSTIENLLGKMYIEDALMNRSRNIAVVYASFLRHSRSFRKSQESHNVPPFSSSEVFPPDYPVSRKDRNKHGGGVFVAISDEYFVSCYVSSTEFSLDSTCELWWCRINIAGIANHFTFCSFYRPTTDSSVPWIGL